jgi:hypothetical protein
VIQLVERVASLSKHQQIKFPVWMFSCHHYECSFNAPSLGKTLRGTHLCHVSEVRAFFVTNVSPLKDVSFSSKAEVEIGDRGVAYGLI